MPVLALRQISTRVFHEKNSIELDSALVGDSRPRQVSFSSPVLAASLRRARNNFPISTILRSQPRLRRISISFTFQQHLHQADLFLLSSYNFGCFSAQKSSTAHKAFLKDASLGPSVDVSQTGQCVGWKFLPVSFFLHQSLRMQLALVACYLPYGIVAGDFVQL